MILGQNLLSNSPDFTLLLIPSPYIMISYESETMSDDKSIPTLGQDLRARVSTIDLTNLIYLWT